MACARRLAAASLPSSWNSGSLASDRSVGPIEEQLPVLAGNAQHPGDHGDGKRRRDLLDEVALAGSRSSSTRESTISLPIRSMSACMRRSALRREAPAHELPVDAVLGRVHLDQRGRELVQSAASGRWLIVSRRAAHERLRDASRSTRDVGSFFVMAQKGIPSVRSQR